MDGYGGVWSKPRVSERPHVVTKVAKVPLCLGACMNSPSLYCKGQNAPTEEDVSSFPSRHNIIEEPLACNISIHACKSRMNCLCGSGCSKESLALACRNSDRYCCI